MRHHKIAMIGDGSVVFCKTLVADILATPALRDSEFALMSPTETRLRRMEAFVGRMIEDNRLPARVWARVPVTAKPSGHVWPMTVPASLPTLAGSISTPPTSSYFDLFKAQILEILEAGLDVVSTAEELSFPWLAHPQDAAEIDAAARRAGKTVLGTGVNPGFIMDSLPLFLTAICQRVDRVDITRVVNASTRRGPFQAKIGSGLTVAEFNERMAAGRMGHVGLPESVGMVFHTLGKTLARYESDVEPVVADRLVKTTYSEVRPGQVMGLKQVARGYTEEGEFMTLTFIAALDAGEDGDTVQITGKPNLEVKLKGTNGDLATVAIAVNALRRVREATPGLVTMADLPIITAW
jgi:4-hydroxy-tetrahydrodipicolinate reductase